MYIPISIFCTSIHVLSIYVCTYMMDVCMYLIMLLYGTQIDDDDDNDEDIELCCICFERTCTIEIRDCRHQMCAGCTLALCCHNKPNPAIPNSPSPTCPFCRQNIMQLKSAQVPKEDLEWLVESENGDVNDQDLVCQSQLKKSLEGSSSNFIGLVGKGSLRLLSAAIGSGRVIDVDAIKECSSEQELCTS